MFRVETGTAVPRMRSVGSGFRQETEVLEKSAETTHTNTGPGGMHANLQVVLTTRRHCSSSCEWPQSSVRLGL